jgi:hypothetical protein
MNGDVAGLIAIAVIAVALSSCIVGVNYSNNWHDIEVKKMEMKQHEGTQR